jgi:hypothetical protein
MKYYDIIAMEHIAGDTPARLGFDRIFTLKDIKVLERPSSSAPYLLRSSEPGMIFRALGDNNCLGIIFKDNVPVKKTLEKTVAEEKRVVIPASEITCSSGPAFMRNTHRLRSVFAACKKAKARTALVSLAASESAVLSALQMLELARFIGAGDEDAKGMISHRWAI